MQIFVPKEAHPGERRVPLTPTAAAKLVKLEADLQVESGLGETLSIADEAYTSAGATISGDTKASLSNADMVLRLRRPDPEQARQLQSGAILISHLDPFNEAELIRTLASAGVSAISIELLPRTTIAQKMDALSSQANLGGYVAVLIAAERIDKVLPMMMTPSGTITPARVFVIGVGVAGLQAIATAKRLGARVEAFDTRPVVEEQVKSLGAKFIKIDLGETGQTKDGYAKELTEEQINKQREEMAKHCANADIVITTAQVFGKQAPLIVTNDMIEGMQPGSVVVDMAVETGGNVEASKLDEEVIMNGVRIVGLGNLPSRVAVNASEMYAANLTNFVEHFWDKEGKTFTLNLENDIIQSCLVTHDGAIRHEKVKAVVEGGE